jgi:hypothetical protein
MDRYIDIPLFLVAVYSSVLSYMYEDHFGFVYISGQLYDISKAFSSLLLPASVHGSSMVHLATFCFANFVVDVMFGTGMSELFKNKGSMQREHGEGLPHRSPTRERSTSQKS